MDQRIERYIETVMGFMDTDSATKKRLTEDLRAHILDAAGDGRDLGEVLADFGKADELALELMDMLYADDRAIVRELIQTKDRLRREAYYEFKSARTFLGLPLLHVRLSRNGRWGCRGARPALAKGVIAVGDVAVGGIAVGSLAFGGLCFGGVALGLLSFGGIGLGLILGIGGVGVGAFAMGGFAIGIYAFGGMALASKVAIGGLARAAAAIGGDAQGAHAISTGGNSLNTAAITKETARALIEKAHPGIWKWLVDLLTAPFQ